MSLLLMGCGMSGTGGTVIFGDSTNKIQLAANGGFVLPFNKDGWFETLSGEGLSGTTGSGSTVGVTVVYAKVPV